MWPRLPEGATNEQYKNIVNLTREAYFDHLKKYNGLVYDALRTTLTVDESFGFVGGNYKEVDAQKLVATERHHVQLLPIVP